MASAQAGHSNADIRLRASFQRAIRGPNVRERFLPQGFNLFEMNADPCAGPVTNGRTAEGRSLEECARSGVTASQFGNIENSPAAQYNFLQGGNPNLTPENRIPTLSAWYGRPAFSQVSTSAWTIIQSRSAEASVP